MVAAPAAAAGTTMFELTAVVHEGRHFPVDSSFEVKGMFDSEESATGLTRANTNPVWGGTLLWKRDVKQIRTLQSQGAKLKLTGARASRLAFKSCFFLFLFVHRPAHSAAGVLVSLALFRPPSTSTR